MSYNIEWVGCHPENYEAGGAVDPTTGIKHVPIAIVDHIMEGSLNGTIQWFGNPQAQASTNYGIGKDGRIVQFVKVGDDRPFANGHYCNQTWTGFIKRADGSIVNPNRYTISIEHEGHTGEPFTEEMYQATLWLHKQLIMQWNIPIDREHIIGHYQIDACTRPNCPGTGFPWDRLVKDLTDWHVSSSNTIIPYPDNTMATVTSAGLNVRQEPSTDTQIIGKLTTNDRIKVVGYIPDWTKVWVGFDGWVWSEYIKVDGVVAPTPVPTPAPAPQPEPTPAPQVIDPIMGKSAATLEQMVYFVSKRNSNFNAEIAKAFLEIGEKYGVRGDVALAQSIVETGWFLFDGGTAVTPDQHNYCGMGVTQKGLKGASFATVQEGVTAQIQHLFAYASKDPLPDGETLLDPRFNLVTRGIAPGWENLNNRWAMNSNYSTSIMSIYNQMLSTEVPKPEPAPEPPKPEPQPTPEPELKKLEKWQYDVGIAATKYLADNKLLNNPETWMSEDKLAESVPVWLFFEMLRRVRESK